jgi:hypothetical protein
VQPKRRCKYTKNLGEGHGRENTKLVLLYRPFDAMFGDAIDATRMFKDGIAAMFGGGIDTCQDASQDAANLGKNRDARAVRLKSGFTSARRGAALRP